MKILVMSDSHGNRDIVLKTHDEWLGKVDRFVHCGDSELRSMDEIWQDFVCVGGNMDFDSGYEDDQVFRAGNHTILLTHGHLYGINFSFDRLFYKAEEVGADIVLYGHLHRIACQKRAGKLFLCPGSIEQPRGELLHKAYCILEVTEDKIEVQYYTKEHVAMKDLHFIF